MNALQRSHDASRAPSGARESLRDATAAQHAQVDSAFPDGLGTPQAYARYLRGMHRFALEFERATGHTPRHSRWLAQDLAAVGLAPLPVLQPQPPVHDADAATGWEYVMAGSSLGARYLVRAVRRLGHSAEHGARFLECHGTSDDWRQVQTRLVAFDVDDAPRLARLIGGARDAFTLVAACLARGSDPAPAQDTEEHALEPSP